MNKPGSRNYHSIHEDASAAVDLSSFENKKGEHPALNNNLFHYNNNNTNSTSITSINNFNNALQQAPLSHNYNCNTLTSLGTSEEYLTNKSLSHYMNLSIEDNLAALSFTRALVYPSNSNQQQQQQQQQQVMNPIQIHAALGPRSFETPMYTSTVTTSVAAVPTTPPMTAITIMGDTMQNTYYGTFDTPYPAATLQSFQDPGLFAPDLQQPSPYPGLGSPPPPMWAPQPHEAVVGAPFNNSLETNTSQNQLQPQQQQQQQQQQQHYHPHTLQYTHHLHPHLHQELSTGVSPHFLSDPSFSPPPPPLMMSPFTEADDSVTSQGTFSPTFSSSEDEEDERDVKKECLFTPTSFPTNAPTYRKKPTKRRAPSTVAAPKTAPVPKQPKRQKPVKTNKVNKQNTNTNTSIAKPPGKLHPCKECGRLFSRACNLQSHQTTHLRQKPYKCPDCPLAFARVYDMKRHHRIHSNLRPYQCEMCPEAFKRIEARERHYLAHHGHSTQGV